MKHLKKFFESSNDDIKDELMDNFAYINDILGQPGIESKKWGNSKKWKFGWSLGLDLSKLQDPIEIITKLKSIIDNFEDIIEAKDRTEGYDIKMALDPMSLIVTVTPEDAGDENYQFIYGQNWRNISINATDLERYLKSKGINVTGMEDVDNESSEEFYVKIDTDTIPQDVKIELNNLFNAELKSKTVDRIDYSSGAGLQTNVDREIEINYTSNGFNIYAIEDKTYVSMG